MYFQVIVIKLSEFITFFLILFSPKKSNVNEEKLYGAELGSKYGDVSARKLFIFDPPEILYTYM